MLQRLDCETWISEILRLPTDFHEIIPTSPSGSAPPLPLPPSVSVGPTPTANYAQELTGVTELRAGVYMFCNLFQAGIGCCDIDELAVSVLTTVIHHKRDLNRILIDAGALALSKDRGIAAQDIDFKYGLVADIHGRPTSEPDRRLVDDVNQEHGDRLDLDKCSEMQLR